MVVRPEVKLLTNGLMRNPLMGEAREPRKRSDDVENETMYWVMMMCVVSSAVLLILFYLFN